MPAKAHDTSPVANLLIDGGYRWEQQVVTNHRKNRVHVAKGRAPLHERTHTLERTIELLTEPAGKTIYQPTLLPAETFHDRYGLDPKLVGFSQCRPDLLEPNGNGRLQVIDLKASDATIPGPSRSW